MAQVYLRTMMHPPETLHLHADPTVFQKPYFQGSGEQVLALLW